MFKSFIIYIIRFYEQIKNKKNHVKLHSTSNILHTTFGGYNVIGAYTRIRGYIGYGSYIGSNCSINAKIGKYCSIAGEVKIVVGTHPTRNFVSTSPSFFSTKKQNGITFVKEEKFEEIKSADDKYAVLIGNDVWIGERVTIISGVTIGNGSIIAAGAVVTKDVAPYSVVGGVPAKMLRMRFSENEIEFLENLKWWDKPIDWIKENADNFEDISKFVEELCI